MSMMRKISRINGRCKVRRISFFSSLLILLIHSFPAHAAPAPVYMEQMTWMEIRDAIKGGATIAIVPVGGTEQNGELDSSGGFSAASGAIAFTP